MMTREEAIKTLRELWRETNDHWYEETYNMAIEALKQMPSAQPEPAIPLQWIEGQIEWLKSLDNAFSTLTAGQISAMVNKWKGEQDE